MNFSLLACVLCLCILAVQFWQGYTLTMLCKASRTPAEPPQTPQVKIVRRSLEDGRYEYRREEHEADGDFVATSWYPTAEEARRADYRTFE